MILFNKPAIEGMGTDEAISNLASLYNTENLKVTNIQTTGQITGPTITALNNSISNVQKTVNNTVNSKINNLDRKVNSVSASAAKNNLPCRWVYSSWQRAAGKNLEYMDRQRAYCSSNEFMQGFHMNRDGKNMRFQMRCCRFR